MKRIFIVYIVVFFSILKCLADPYKGHVVHYAKSGNQIIAAVIDENLKREVRCYNHQEKHLMWTFAKQDVRQHVVSLKANSSVVIANIDTSKSRRGASPEKDELVVISLATGEELWRVDTGWRIRKAYRLFDLSESHLVSVESNGELLKVRNLEGNVQWAKPVNVEGISNVVSINNGNILLVHAKGMQL